MSSLLTLMVPLETCLSTCEVTTMWSVVLTLLLGLSAVSEWKNRPQSLLIGLLSMGSDEVVCRLLLMTVAM